MSDIKLYTIGFTKKSAEQFFAALKQAGVRLVIDVRLNNASQLAGFAKRGDLPYFLREIGNIGYEHRPDLAPTEELLSAFRSKAIDWDAYEREFGALMRSRSTEKGISRQALDNACLLCSEPDAEHCHRRIVAEHLRDTVGGISICHL